MKAKIKKKTIDFFNQLLREHDSQQELNDKFVSATLDIPKIKNTSSPFFVDMSLDSENQHSSREDIVFITSRFRSGSTLLWNLFRETGICTSYYEPFNERRWFDRSSRGDTVDVTHRGVRDYWAEYENLEELGKLYSESWIHSKLMMTETSWDPKMREYLLQLIAKSDKRPVLQFNRIDFRLPWLTKHFPNAKILHLYRHPRDQWCSFLTDSKLMNKDDVEHTYQDAFYLDVWCRDLAKYYPVLDIRNTPHPYQRFYYLWKLSYLHGVKFSNLSISYDNLIENPKYEIYNIFSLLNIDVDTTKLSNIIQAPPPQRWKKYADNTWFSHHENICEHNLSLMLGNRE